MRMSWKLGWAVVLTAAVSAAGEAPMSTAGAKKPWVAGGRDGMVASDSAYASRAGAEILRSGGNAIDAAAATSLALGVTRPYSTGLGGGGFLMVRLGKTGEVFILDYRECAPGAASRDMFVKARAGRPDASPPSQFGGLAVGVPGLLAGHAKLLGRFGTRTLAQVVEPARKLAAEGFAADENYCTNIRDAIAKLETHPDVAGIAATLKREYLRDGKALKVGDIVRGPAMAETLGLIAAQGPDAFYRGRVAEAIVKTVRASGGVMTLEDLAGYQPVWREPIRSRYRDYEVLLMPPPSSGGICIAEALNILRNWDMKAVERRDPGLAAHLTVEAIKHAFADRARYLGDADFAKVPVSELTDEAHGRRLAGRINEDKTSKPEQYGWSLKDDSGTTHFCVADRWGNVVSATETINTGFGSLVVAEGTGVVLNDEMDDFTAEPGKANAFGLQQSVSNEVAPRKRPLSSMSPTIVLENGRPVLAVGASGGPRIISATLQVMLDVLDYGMLLDEAIRRPRVHHQWQPDVVYRNSFPADDPVIAGLRRRGHEISDSSREAIVQGLKIDGQAGKGAQLTGVSDPRKGGEPAGF
jgi:gamma-glutamyltranspeptidase / glutathione hydrolase